MSSRDGEQQALWEAQLLGELRAFAWVSDPVPPEVVFPAKGAFAWRQVDADLAELVADSLAAPPIGIRSSQGGRLISFEGGALTVEVEVAEMAEAGDRRRLVGQLLPPQRALVEVRSRAATIEVATGGLGHFIVDGLPAGPVSLRCRLEGRARIVETDWVVI